MSYDNNRGRGGYRGNTQEKGSNTNAKGADVLGESFHNPYTFLPFPDEIEAYYPTSLTADENPDEERKTGILELDIKTLSPLMTCEPTPISTANGHNTYKALTIDNDVIVPATGMRGTLRTLMTILSKGALGYMDEDLWLTQARDAQLGPSSKMPGVPKNAFLGKVVKVGNATHTGLIQLGETKLIKADDLEKAIRNIDRQRPTTGRDTLFVDDSTYPKSMSNNSDNNHKWQVKLSGRPIMRKAKKEGLFKANKKAPLELSEEFWKTYQGRHKHSAHSELRKGDLVWLEPSDYSCTEITCEEDISSLQWARWGRHGIALKDIIPEAVLPTSMSNDGAVDFVTNMFGQIPHKDFPDSAGPFASRLRLGNLVFRDAKNKTITETLAPLAAPHPGCVAFYRDQENLDTVNNTSPLKGYKVYRNTIERGDSAPWKFSVQGVFDDKGRVKSDSKQKVNKTAELLKDGNTGVLRIAFRALSLDELALIYAACSVDWKVGGGKPLGLGHCRVVGLRMIDEDGKITEPMGKSENENSLKVSDNDFEMIEYMSEQIDLYRASQLPVKKLRYPRAVTKNNFKNSRAGLSWFARHATPKKNGNGLETLWTGGDLKAKANDKTQIESMGLPKLDANNTDADLLYGYDMVDTKQETTGRNQKIINKLEPFDESKHISGNEASRGNTSQNRDTRRDGRNGR